MADAFKEKFNSVVIGYLAAQITLHWPQFNKTSFEASATQNIDTLELKARSNQIVNALLEYMPADFEHASHIIQKSLAEELPDENLNFETGEDGIAGWMLMPVADYISCKTLQQPSQNLKLGMALLKACTKRFTAEFAIRPLLRDFPTETLAYLHEWASDPNLHVRRLVSEGSRPMLPWGIRLHAFIDDPNIILPLLEQLKNDESEYVRRSVANSLNDIAKHHPDLVANIAETWWHANNKNRTKLLKHACRTLIKDGHPKVLSLLGYEPASLSKVTLKLRHAELAHGSHQEIELQLESASSETQALLIDYVVHHQKANGTLTPKVFKWTSVKLGAKTNDAKTECSRLVLNKRHSFKAVTTRKYYSGEHKIEILINGEPFIQQSFVLV